MRVREEKPMKRRKKKEKKEEKKIGDLRAFKMMMEEVQITKMKLRNRI